MHFLAKFPYYPFQLHKVGGGTRSSALGLFKKFGGGILCQPLIS